MNDLEALYRQHAAAIFRFALGLCGERSAAEDLVSETFVRLATRAPRLETRTALAYLLAIARNTHLKGRRRSGREVPLSDEIPDPAQDPVILCEDRGRLAAVLRDLRALPEGERTALLLRVDHDLSYEEIATVLGTTVGAARVRVHRARLRLAGSAERRENRDDARSDA